MSKLLRYIKTKSGDKEPMHTTSVNITDTQRRFLELNSLNLSQIVRDAIDALIESESNQGVSNE